MASHVAAAAFGHCLALVRDEETATRLAVVAVRRGGRSLGAVLGHARHLALVEVAGGGPAPVALSGDATPSEVAWALAGTRPPVEVALIDLSGRHGLSRSGLGLALRLSPGAAAARVSSAAQVWDAHLDPALLAWLGPGDCAELAALLEGRQCAEAADLLLLGGDVAAHTATCPACADRQRAMASVRLLVSGTPLPAPPPTVVAAASGSRLQPPLPPPALVPRRRRAPLRALGAGAVVVGVLGLGLGVMAGGGSGGSREAALQALTKVPAAAGSLQLVPATVRVATGEVALVNPGAGTVAWEAATDAPWLHVSPERGRLAAGETQALRLRGEAPEGEVRALVTVAGDDGSAAATTVEGTVERPPDLTASADGCRVTVVVEDEGEVSLILHWRGSDGERTSVMAGGPDAMVADLPAATAPLTWWVTAVDGRGNQARTPDVALPGGC